MQTVSIIWPPFSNHSKPAKLSMRQLGMHILTNQSQDSSHAATLKQLLWDA